MKETLEGITQKVTTAITQKVTTVTSFNTSRDGGLGASKGVAAVGKKPWRKASQDMELFNIKKAKVTCNL